MAKTDGTQNIPSALLDKYRATLGEEQADNTVEKRYPFRVPTMQTIRGTPSATQRAQRTAFLAGKAKFDNLSVADRQRWYARRPPWSSYLWYYNWFMLNAVPNLWQAVPGGDAVLNNIQVIETNLATGGGLVNIPVTVMATKCVVMLQGASWKQEMYATQEWDAFYAWPVYPILSNISNTQIDLRWAVTPQVAAHVSATIIEYI